jgi:ATP-dependent Clp protease ATP-binding subunit ClpC
MLDQLSYTPRARKSLRLAAREAKASYETCVGPGHIFLGLFLEGDGVAGRVLKDLGLRSETIRAEILRELGRNKCGS